LFLDAITYFLPFISLACVHLFEVSPKISTLSEILAAVLARERSLTCMFSEMVSEITRLLEDTAAARVHALEEQLLSLSAGVLDLDHLVPVGRNAFKVLAVIF
jgi:hypothetical protein